MFHAFISVVREVNPLGIRSKLTLSLNYQWRLSNTDFAKALDYETPNLCKLNRTDRKPLTALGKLTAHW